jgi:predicted DNA-binding transcriptional regulator AlpA
VTHPRDNWASPTSGAMTDLPGVSETRDPRHTFLTAQQVIARYGWGRTKGYQVLRRRDFPKPVAGDRYRLDTLMAWEDSQLEEPRSSTGLTPFPDRKRRSASSQ